MIIDKVTNFFDIKVGFMPSKAFLLFPNVL